MASIVVVGGGIAGLTCAWRLRRAGHEVEVLERAGEPGGRLRTEHVDGFQLERGTPHLFAGDRNLHAVADSLGLGDRLEPVAGSGWAVLRGGRLHAADPARLGPLLRSDLLGGASRPQLLRLAWQLWRQRQAPSSEHAATLDGLSLAEGLRAAAGQEALEWLFEPLLTGHFHAEPEEVSHAFGLRALRALRSRSESMRGGNGLLIEGLAAQVMVRTGCEVFSVETETDGAKVRYRTQRRERSVFADAVVVAVPGTQVAALCPKLTPDERGFFEALRYQPGMTVQLPLERAPAAPLATRVILPRRLGLSLQAVDLAHYRAGAAPPGAGLIEVSLAPRATARLWEASDASVEALVLQELALTPLGSLRPLHARVLRNERAAPQLPPGSLGRLVRFRTRIERTPRLAFAGDFLLGPGAEAALSSGMRAATEIVRIL